MQTKVKATVYASKLRAQLVVLKKARAKALKEYARRHPSW